MLLLHITSAGMAREQDALLNGIVLSPITHIVFGSGTPIDPPSGATAIVQQWQAAPILIKEKLSDGAIKLTADLDVTVAGRIREVGLMMEDGTLYAYAPYLPDEGGLFKAAGFSFRLSVILARENISEISIRYEVVDTAALAAQIAAEARAQITNDDDQFKIAATRHLSSLNAEILRQSAVAITF
jgi:hypothetical protein